MNTNNIMTDAELASSVRYLAGQIAYLDGETPLTAADEGMIRERNDYLLEITQREIAAEELAAAEAECICDYDNNAGYKYRNGGKI